MTSFMPLETSFSSELTYEILLSVWAFIVHIISQFLHQNSSTLILKLMEGILKDKFLCVLILMSKVSIYWFNFMWFYLLLGSSIYTSSDLYFFMKNIHRKV